SRELPIHMIPAMTCTHRNVRSSNSSECADMCGDALRADCSRCAATVLQDPHEPSPQQLVERHAGHRHRFVLPKRAAIYGAEEKVEESLTRRGVVEHVTDERRLRRALHEIPKPGALLLDSGEEKRIHGGIPGHELCRVQIPSLIEARLERMAHVVVMQPPRVMHTGPVFFEL